jgi:hypothetical protein
VTTVVWFDRLEVHLFEDDPMFRRLLASTLTFAAIATGTASATEAPATPASVSATTTAAQQTAELRARLEAGRRRLDFLAGPWELTLYNRNRDGEWIPNGTQSIVVEPSMNDLYLRLVIATPGFNYEMTLSYDVLMDTYRVVSRDDQSGLIDVYEGNFTPDGSLVTTNLRSGTHYLAGSRRIHNRMTLTPGVNGWTSQIEGSGDEGATWRPQGRSEARRP